MRFGSESRDRENNAMATMPRSDLQERLLLAVASLTVRASPIDDIDVMFFNRRSSVC